MIEPQGPLPSEIYWRRRIVAGGVAVAALALVIGLIVWTTSGGDKSPSNTASASSMSTTTSPAYGSSESSGAPSGGAVSGGGTGGGGGAAAGASGQPGASPASGSAAAPAVGADGTPLCPDQNIAVVLYTDKPTYTVGDQPVFTIVTTNAGLTACARDVGKAAQNVVVRTLDGTRTLWAAQDCSPLKDVNTVVLQPQQQAKDTITWSGTTSNPGCDKPRVQVPVGSYQAIGKIGEKESAPITFNVVAPAQQ
ncbi:hypothetical protein [Gordonia otitidis]|uniref:Uncharacterized protein n=1 Tax=Gordonia otitidis (strain DSM 44809 / CCUG 52243 / JCM 12355 / NBRC 100426 / IFM 10032) TaxID=1108044 RepID=H5TQ16_GORO1|nr:hypothetical protein [Gordonia otitidis]UEA57724.1 hypothetical protein LK459_13990 [Gordonia otitidis]GAB35574.1 hypothetical protein GOOTI_170_00410 [Gordonia otitidis NBRC 100426]